MAREHVEEPMRAMVGEPNALPADAELDWLWLALESGPQLATLFRGPEHTLVYQNARSVARYGRRPVGLAAPLAFPEHPRLVALLEEVWERAEAVVAHQDPVTLADAGGTRRAVFDTVCSPVHDHEGPWGVLIQAAEVPPEHPARDNVRDAATLALASAELWETLEPDQVALTIARLASEVFEGWCVVDRWRADGALHRVGRHVDPECQPLLDRLLGFPPASGRGGESVAMKVARSGRSVLGRYEPSVLAAGAVNEEHAELLAVLGPTAYLIVPIETGPRRLGALSLIRPPAGGDFSPHDMHLARQFAERAAIALSHAQDYDEQRQAILTLQRNVLPQAPPRVPGLEVAVRYRAAGSGSRIGGDWYDVFPLGEGSLGIVVGDVQGHDLAAAAAMGQIRSVVHSHARAGLPTAEVAAHANAFACEQVDERLVTVALAQVFPRERLMIWTRAGHVPSVTVAGGRAEVHDRGGCLPLGIDRSATFLEHTTRLAAHSVTAIFSDGLVETPTRSVDAGTDQLIALLHEHGHLPIHALADRVITEMLSGERSGDDVALVLFRLVPEDPGPARTLERRLLPTAASSTVARHYLSAVLEQWGVGGECASTAALLVTELVSNAVRHSTGEIVLRAQLGERLRVSVYDESYRLPLLRETGPDDTAGRGLQLVECLSAAWGVDSERTGKSVWFELEHGAS
ncbi:MAG: SpoIIE family protein phosphatase [Actinomycetota bacterium]|nr:SpoIIE family protein phosphatase [Actinomycetota bacterium]